MTLDGLLPKLLIESALKGFEKRERAEVADIYCAAYKLASGIYDSDSDRHKFAYGTGQAFVACTIDSWHYASAEARQEED